MPWAVGTSLSDPTGWAPVYRTRTLSNRAMKRPVIIIAGLLTAAALVVGIVQTQESTTERPAGDVPGLAEARAQLAGAPEPLAKIHEQANQLLPIEEFEPRLESLRGYPVVVNVWGSWCRPCREEFPILQRVSAKLGKRVAFLGIATQDAEDDTRKFLAERPLTYPSFMDFQGETADKLGVIGAPAMIFYDVNGERAYFHQGIYRSDEDLIRDIERYLLA